MAASQTSICNLALTRLGAGRITDIDESSVEAGHCRLFYDQALDELLRGFPWSFAIKRTSLPRLTTAPAFGWTYAYQLPSDYRYVLECNGYSQDTTAPLPFAVEGGELLCDETTAKVRYTRNATDPAEYPADFVQAFATLLAAKLAVPVTGNAQLGQVIHMEFEQLEKPKAARNSSNESRDKRRDRVINDSDLVAARYSG